MSDPAPSRIRWGPLSGLLSDLQSAIDAIDAERFDDPVHTGLIARGEDDEQFEPDVPDVEFQDIGGLEPMEDVIVLSTTNRMDCLDPAVLRSGRFGMFIEVPPPDAAATRAIFAVHAADLPLADLSPPTGSPRFPC